eukprot:6489977-Amphidinium_carterae.2
MQNAMVAHWSWLALGCPPGGKSATVLRAPLTQEQRACISPVVEHLRRMSRQAASMSEACGGSKVTRLLSELSAWRELSPYTSTQQGRPAVAPTISLNSANMALPKIAAKVELSEPILPLLAADILKEPGVFGLAAEIRPRLAPSFLHVDHWPSVASTLCESGLMCLRQSDRSCLRAGLLGVEKKGTTQARLIVDRRP